MIETQGRRTTVGVMGSAGVAEGQNSLVETLAITLGRAIVKKNCVLVTGETTGLPGKVLEIVKSEGGLTIGISPAHTKEEQKEKYGFPSVSSDVVIYTGFGLKGRNVINIRSSDIVIIISGSIGTLNEFTIAYDEGKIIGVIQNSGGVADMLEAIVTKLNKKTKATMIYDSNVEALLDKCLLALEQK